MRRVAFCKRLYTGKNKRKNVINIVQVGIGAFTLILVCFIINMMIIVSGIQGTARVVNYAGLVRGKTQRIVKLEISGSLRMRCLTRWNHL